ncbi:glycosyltransferase family 2 protein [Leptothoe sp. PORK10 BA2]|uniref:glycosyltransferase family 2 protein n=1 Tax=Leptothoe sp. PORK10 BA2 TaxID=3110254 RepID=UPI002B205A8A|nr:glycosyltransferase family 2 protein [Leptothoe sp. PORK10 BA2]MEA5465663.1 glycosyltransferase family 2 protein [Leptothoe sp. PORK10 BA2]
MIKAMFNAPLISVIIPTYNRLDYLKEAIASVINQTYTNLEIIVSDDCSDESPQPIVESFQDPRLRLRRNAKNVGIGLNSTYAFAETHGKYVASLNDDDRWDKDFLEKLVHPLEENSELVLAFCDYYIMDDHGHVNWAASQKHSKREKRHKLQEGIYQPFWKIGLVDQAVFTASAALIRRNAVSWDKLFKAGVFWDYYLAYLGCRSGQGAYYCSERLAYYRMHAKSENMVSGSRNIQAKIRKGKAATFCHQQFMEDENLRDYRSYFQREWAHASTTLGIGFLRLGQPVEARFHLHQSWRHQKFSLRTLIALSMSYLPQSMALSLAHMPNPGLTKLR